jgi:hypothetical protein
MRQPTARRRLPGGGPTPGPADFKLPQLQAGLGLDSRQDSRTAPATSVWPAVADGSTAEHAPQAICGIGRARQRTRGPPGGGPLGLQSPVSPQCRVIGESVLRPKTCATGSNGLSGQGQRSVSTSSRRKAGFRRTRRFLHVCQARRAGPWDLTVAGQPGRPAASVQTSTTGFMSDRSQTLPSGGSLPVHWSNNSGYADSESRQGFSVCTRRREQRGAWNQQRGARSWRPPASSKRVQ